MAIDLHRLVAMRSHRRFRWGAGATSIRTKASLTVGATLALLAAGVCAGLEAWSLLLAVVTSGGVILILLDRLIVSRLERLSASLEAIGIGGNPAARVTMPGHDELASLAASVNEMLGGLDRAQEERRHATESLRQQRARISLLNRITRAIAERQDLSSLFHVVLGCLEDQLPIEFGEVYYGTTGGASVVALGPASRALVAGTGLAESGLLSGEEAGLAACLRGETVYVSDTAAELAPELRRLTRLGLRSAVATPLAAGGTVFGILVAARRAPDGFASGDVEFLRSLSEHVTLAAGQVRLHEELRRAYDELRQSQQDVLRQERLRALGQMASGITHDVNNALSPVVGYADLLLEEKEPLGERTRRFVEKIRIAGLDIGDTVARMRGFYRHRADDELRGPVDLNQLVLQVVDLTRPRWKDMTEAQGRGLTVATDLEPDLPLLAGVEGELRSAVINLVFNAVDAMPEGGTITLRTRQVGDRVVLELVDTGAGMDEATRDRCLEPFFTTKGGRGTGLGLAMVHGIVRRHEGTIEIETEPGGGTTMRCLLPVPHGAVLDVTAEAGAAEGPTPLRILCIDDEPPLRELLTDLLTGDGHAVVAADDGVAGLQAFGSASSRGDPFDVVITDLGMPRMDGREVARAVKEVSASTPVILLTAWGSSGGAGSETGARFDGVLAKPPRLDQLRVALSRAIRTVPVPAS